MKKKIEDICTIDAKRGSWFLTYTGKRVFPGDPRPEDFCIEDVAHGLSLMCRFGGQCRTFYSVAQHSVLVSQICTEAPFEGLMHDADEGVGMLDCIRPLKILLPDYQKIQSNFMAAICKKFRLPTKFHEQVKWADNVLLMTERRDLICVHEESWDPENKYPPLKQRIIPWSHKKAEREFLKRFKELYH